MKGILRAGTLAIVAVTCATAQERSPFGTPPVAAGAQANVQANVSQQVSNPLLLNISGTTVRDESGQQLGQIQHLVVSPQGCVDMAVLSVGGAKLVPIPWQLVEVSQAAVGTTGATGAAATTPGRIALKLNVDRQKLQQAPSFNMNQVTQITQQQTMQQVFNFYGVQSQTQTEVGATASQSSSISGGTSSTNAAQTSSQTTLPPSTNQFGSQGASAATNQFGTQSRSTNQFGFGSQATNQFGTQAGATNQQQPLSPTGQTSGYPNRPSVAATNSPATNNPSFRPPFNRPPDNRPPTNTPPGQPPSAVGQQ